MAGDPQGSTVRVDFDARVFSIDVVQRAALKFSEVFSCSISLPDEATIAVDLDLRSDHTAHLSQIVGNLRTEVLDQALRARIAKETEAERNLILAYAFSNTKLIQP